MIVNIIIYSTNIINYLLEKLLLLISTIEFFYVTSKKNKTIEETRIISRKKTIFYDNNKIKSEKFYRGDGSISKEIYYQIDGTVSKIINISKKQVIITKEYNDNGTVNMRIEKITNKNNKPTKRVFAVWSNRREK